MLRSYSIAALFALSSYQLPAVGRAQDIRKADPGIERGFQRPAVDKSMPDRPIVDWDSSALQSRMKARHAEPEAKITDPEILALARSDKQFERDPPGGFYLEATWEGVGRMESSDPKLQDEGFYLQLSAALKGDPWAYCNLAFFGSRQGPDHPDAQYRVDLLRRAADQVPEDPATIEAYLRYGLDLGMLDGTAGLADFLVRFYIYSHPERPADGYVERAQLIEKEFGLPGKASYDRAQAFLRGVDRPQDNKAAFRMALQSMVEGRGESSGMVGAMLSAGRGVDYDFELARDYLAYCVEQFVDPQCVRNVAAFVNSSKHDVFVPDVALAFLKFAFALDPIEYARLQPLMEEIEDYMSPAERVLAETLQRHLAARDFSSIPLIRDARPVDPAALLARQ